ncbi:dihydrofolate reductase [Sporobacter termitidis DSM 10068]|uniref:dihydrofolate reductase n=1 Tax=Sporobacter termitidis DSM 10068 TaxID=1123282 RepID=A0A1M5U4D7_9FIRM|nr:dihydrofolate reductase [Sporobacter termitidis]SHH57543.1 dihydrofolate reductase [Sporobacter termitidis DSM 10068]
MDLIVAVDSNWGIGKGGTQTVVLPEDRRRFRELTNGGTVIVGHRTLLDFPGGKPLPGRRNIVMSRNKDLKIEGAAVVASTDELFREIAGTAPDKVFVIGGDKIFRLLLPYCTRAFITKIKAAPESDTFFPNLDALQNWTLEDAGSPKAYDGIEYAFQVYRNNAPLGV